MQIGTVPIPPVPASNPAAQTAVQNLPQVQALAAAPITQKAVGPSNKSESSQSTRDSADKHKEDGDAVPGEESNNGRGHIINTSV